MNKSEAAQNKIGNVRITEHKGVFWQQLLQWKAISITHSECVFGDVGIRHAMRVRRIVRGLAGSTIFFRNT
jgi:hypothetical protein